MVQSAAEVGRSGPLGPSDELGAKARSPSQIFWDRLKQDKLALFGGALVVFMVLMAVSAGVWEKQIVDHAYSEQYRDRLNEFGTPTGPDKEFWFGVDNLGRDLFIRVLHGARVSLGVAFVATGIEVFLGVLLGMAAGFLRGWVDTTLSRLMDLILSIPFLLLGIALSVSLGGGVGMVIGIIAFFGWPYIARIVRGQTLSLRESQFVEAAFSVGAPTRWIMLREILPNLVAPVIVYATLIIPVNIVAEAALSFLGVGIQEPTPAWGTMLEQATRFVLVGSAWWYMVYPGLALFITVLGFNLLGDGLRDALDPKTAR